MLTYRVYKAPFCQYGLDSENLPSLSIKSRNGQQHGASRTTTRNPMHLKIDEIAPARLVSIFASKGY